MFTSVAHISNDKLDTLTFAEIIDYHADHNPGHPFTVFPGAAVGDDLSRISYLEFGRATQRFARAIYPDAPVKQREVVGVIVNADSLMWTTAVAGLIRAGSTVSDSYVDLTCATPNAFQAFPISPRNSPAAICHILRTVSSHRLIVTESSLQSLVDDVKAELAASGYALAVKELPTLDTIYPHLASETTKHEFEPIALPPRSGNPNEVVMYIHSSGSTGFPKSIPIPQEMFFKLSNDTLVEPLQNYDKPYRT
jgi:acyl-CoA synthetase (AMP-forming)/AMP-acid ligase II